MPLVMKPDPSQIPGEAVKKPGKLTKNQVLNQSVYDALMNVKPDQLKGISQNREVIKGTAQGPVCWLHSPAHLELLAVADRRLTRVGLLGGLKDKKVQRVTAQLIEGTRLLAIQASHSNDLTALPVNRYRGGTSAWINLIDLLAEDGLTVETGYRERYAVALIPEGSPLWPGLVIDLDEQLDRRLEPVKKKSAKKSGGGKASDKLAKGGAADTPSPAESSDDSPEDS